MVKDNLQIRLEDKEQNCTIRKYMDYPKFLSLITTNSLYFARPEEFDDPLDSLFPDYTGIKNDINNSGILEKTNKDFAQSYFNAILSNLNKTFSLNPTREQIYLIFESHLLPVFLKDTFLDDINIFPTIQVKIWDLVDLYMEDKNDKAVEKLNEFYTELQIMHTLDTRELNKKRALINCWHIGNYESDLMWKIYAQNVGIMIQTTVEKLLSLDYEPYITKGATCVIDKIKYIDLIKRDEDKNNLHLGNKGENGNNDILCHYFEKNKSLQDEKELRIVIAENKSSLKEVRAIKQGELVKINMPISDFIEKIVVSPYAPNFYHKTLYNTLINMNYKSLADKIEISTIKHLQKQMLI